MELIKTRYRIRCEMGGCKGVADYTVKTARVGIRAHLHICSNCLSSLYELMAKEIVPKPIENPIGGRGRKSRSKAVEDAVITEPKE